jgi:hypothetical protein
MMNYEDRPDLEPPPSIVDGQTLGALATGWAGAKEFLTEAFDSAVKPLNQSVEEVLTGVIRPEVELEGAPPQAWPLGITAARAGYRLGGSMLGQPDEAVDRDEASRLVEVVRRIYAYGLYEGASGDISRDLQSKLAELITDAGAPREGDFEQHAIKCFSLGLATAVVQFDRAYLDAT